MALSVPADRHRGLHGGQVVSDPAFHGGPLRSGVRPHRGRGLFLPAGGDRARQADQAADLGHRGPGALQVRRGSCGWDYVLKRCVEPHSEGLMVSLFMY